MRRFLRFVSGAVGMGLTWAVGWALVGVLIEMFVDPTGSIVGTGVLALEISSFLGGVAFSTVHWSAEGHRTFNELSLPDLCVPYAPEFVAMAQADVA